MPGPITYAWKDGPLPMKAGAKAVDVQDVGEALAELTTPGGDLDVHLVPEAAANRRSPLHPFFTWNDKEAAKERRLDQARALVRSIRIVAADNTPPKPAYFSIQADGGRRYRTAASLVDNLGLQTRLYENALRDLEAFSVRYQRLVSVCELILPAIEATQTLILDAAKQIKIPPEDAA